ncbi:MAG: serine protease [Elusimicrobiota bacterium]
MRALKLILSAALLTAAFPLLSPAQGRSIYGDDNRLEYHEASADIQRLAGSVVSLWDSKDLKADGGNYRLRTVKFGDALKLCPSERFRDQPAGAFCSGTLVGEDIIMTAGHCIVDNAGCAGARFVFGYSIRRAGAPAATTIPAGEVYACKRIIKRDLSTQPATFLSAIAMLIGNMVNGGTGPDYALIQLDRKVTNHKPLAVNRGKGAAKGTGLFVIGHPVGLPLKVAGSASVRDASPRYFFMTDLDTFGGNSGSAVFNANTKLIEGILVRGGTDFVKSPAGCTVSYQVGQKEGKGEAVTKIAALSAYIPHTGKAAGLNKEIPEMMDMKLDTSEPQQDMSRSIRFQ